MASIGEKDDVVDIKDDDLAKISQWESIDFHFNGKYAEPCLLDQTHIVLAGDGSNKYLYSFDMVQYELKKIFPYPQEVKFTTQSSLAINKEDKKLYITCRYIKNDKISAFLEYDLDTDWSEIHNIGHHIDYRAKLCSLSDTIHLIGGFTNANHYIWNNNQFILKQSFNNTFNSDRIQGHAIVSLNKIQQIMLMGGNNSKLFGGYLNDIWICKNKTIFNQNDKKKLNTNNYNIGIISIDDDFSDNDNKTDNDIDDDYAGDEDIDEDREIEWIQKKDVQMPYKMYYFGYCLSSDENFLIIFGGKTSKGLTDEIWILNLKTWKWIKSDMKCPKKSKYYAIRSNDNYIYLFEMDKPNLWKSHISSISISMTKLNKNKNNVNDIDDDDHKDDINMNVNINSNDATNTKTDDISSWNDNITATLKINLVHEKLKSDKLQKENDILKQKQYEYETELAQYKAQNGSLINQNKKLKREYIELEQRKLDPDPKIINNDDIDDDDETSEIVVLKNSLDQLSTQHQSVLNELKQNQLQNKHFVDLKKNLQNEILKKNNQYKELMDNYQKLKLKYDILLQKENHYKNFEKWNHEQVLKWIIQLENGRFKQYGNDLKVKLKEEKITGYFLVDLNGDDLHRLGVTQDDDKNSLIKWIQELTKQNDVIHKFHSSD